MKTKITFFFIITAILCSIFITTVSANEDISIYVNDSILQCDVKPYIENGRTMVPMRKIFEALDASVDWNGTTKTINATKENTTITLQIGSFTMYKNGEMQILDVAPVIVNNLTFVPLRAVSQSLNANVEWSGERRCVYINSPYTYNNETSQTKITMYAPDGRTIEIYESEAESYKNVGWYYEPVTLMYAADGRTTYVANSEIEAYQNVGWYLNPVTTVYAPDGRTMLIYEYELGDYLNVGWYKTYEEAKAAAAPPAPTYENCPNSGGTAVYRTPSGKRYHYDPDCGGRNSYRITMQQALNAGLTPCKKCA